MTPILRTPCLLAAGLATVALAACTPSSTSRGAQPVTSSVTTAAPTAATDSASATTTPSATNTPTPSSTTTSASPSATPSTTTSAPPPAQSVADVDWQNARLPIMCGGPVEMVQLTKGRGATKDGLVVEYLDTAIGSVTADPVANIAVIELDCIGAHPGPVDAPVFRSSAGGPEFLGWATMSLDRFVGATVSAKGIVVRGDGYSDKAAGCCADLRTTMISTVRGGAVELQERETSPLVKGHTVGGQCSVLQDIGPQSTALSKQTKGPALPAGAVHLAALTPAVAADRARHFLDVLRAQLQRGCP